MKKITAVSSLKASALSANILNDFTESNNNIAPSETPFPTKKKAAVANDSKKALPKKKKVSSPVVEESLGKKIAKRRKSNTKELLSNVTNTPSEPILSNDVLTTITKELEGVVDSPKADKKKKTGVKAILTISASAAAPKSEVPSKNRPYSQYGLHGSNVDLEGYKSGDDIKFVLKGQAVYGKFVHFHINKHSPNGYAVIKGNDGKIYERVIGKFELKVPVVKKVKKVKAKVLAEDSASK